MKIKCVKAGCPICKLNGPIQLFLNRNGEVKYARTRHYSHIDKVSKKLQFTYCKLNLEELKTLLNSQGVSLSIGKADSGQIGQGRIEKIHDLELKDSSLVQQNMCGRRLVWFRTLAFQANDPGFKSRRPHQRSSNLSSGTFSNFQWLLGWTIETFNKTQQLFSDNSWKKTVLCQ
jgi:hypothetical protein